MENSLKPMNGDIILCVSISKTLNKRGSLYEATRKWWKHRLEYVKQATHVVGIYKGKVKIVFEDMEWKYTEEKGYRGRVEFTSKHPNGQIESPYKGKYYRMYRATRMLK